MCAVHSSVGAGEVSSYRCHAMGQYVTIALPMLSDTFIEAPEGSSVSLSPENFQNRTLSFCEVTVTQGILDQPIPHDIPYSMSFRTN